jgi:hypothetical protein
MRWLLLGLLVACSSPSPAPKVANTTPASTEPDPRAFALRMIDTLEHDDLAGWKQLLSDRQRARLADDDLLHGQLQAWRRDLLPKAQRLRTASFSLDQTGPQHFVLYSLEGREPEALVMVTEDHGALRIDEN